MNEDITINPERTNRGAQQMQREDLFMQRADDMQMGPQMQMNMHAASGVVCPHCGTINDPEAVFCASCGSQIGRMSCPNCGAELDADADFCETCRRYVRKDVCSFCGAHLSGNEAFCPESER